MYFFKIKLFIFALMIKSTLYIKSHSKSIKLKYLTNKLVHKQSQELSSLFGLLFLGLFFFVLFLLVNGLLLLFLLFLLVHWQVDKFQNLFILDWVLGLEERLVKWEASQGGCFALGHHDGEFELSNECAWLFHDDWIRNQKLVFETFLESESSYVWIFEAVHAETEGRISAEHVVEELPALLDFQIVWSVEGSLVHIGSDFSLNKSKPTYLVFPSPLLTKTSRARRRRWLGTSHRQLSVRKSPCWWWPCFRRSGAFWDYEKSHLQGETLHRNHRLSWWHRWLDCWSFLVWSVSEQLEQPCMQQG